MVGNHHHDRHVELAATVAPQQIEQAVVFLGRHDCDAFGLRRLGQPEIHIELRGNLLAEISFERIARGRQPGQVEYRPLHERAAGLLGGMLIQRHDVGARAGEECTYRRHQSRSVGTAQQQPTDILDRQTPATCARVLLLHLLQGVTPWRLRSQNPHILRRSGPDSAASIGSIVGDGESRARSLEKHRKVIRRLSAGPPPEPDNTRIALAQTTHSERVREILTLPSTQLMALTANFAKESTNG